MTAAFPAGLRTILRASKARSQEASFATSNAQQGYAHAQATGNDRPVIWDIGLAFTRQEAETFRDWFRDDIASGVDEFTLPIRTEFGLVEHVVRFLPGGLLDLRENGAVWTYTARIATRSQSVIGSAVEPGSTWSIDLSAVTNGGSTSAVGVLATGFNAARSYRVTQPSGRLYAGYSAWPSDGSTLPPTTPDDEKWGNDLKATQFPGADVGTGDARTTSHGVDRGYPDGETARAAFAPAIITGATQFKLWVGDPNPTDNRGGISIFIEEAVKRYPPTLPSVVRAMKSRSQPASFAMDTPRRGLGYARSLGTQTPLLWDVCFRLTQTEAAEFALWFVYTINRGVDNFTMPIQTEYGLLEYTLRFLPNTPLDLREDGEVFTYKATLLARAEITA